MSDDRALLEYRLSPSEVAEDGAHAAVAWSGLRRRLVGDTPARARKSACHEAKGTSPEVCVSMRRAVTESGNRRPFRYRLIAACDRPTFSANAASAFSSRLR